MRMAGVWWRTLPPAFALLLGCAALGHAAGPAATDPPKAGPGGTVSPHDEALAFVREQSARNPGGSFLGTFRTGMINTLVERGKLSPKDAERAIDQYFMPIYVAHFGELEVKLAAIWAAHFTPAEIQGLREIAKNPSPEHEELFKSTSLGRKYVGEQPEINHESGIAAREWGQPITCIAFQTHGPDLVKMGVDPELVKPPPGACPR
jgi:hypothetical protein